MDNLLEALKTGSAFSMAREKRTGNRRTPRAAGGNNSLNIKQQLLYLSFEY